ncbi:type I-E CRISPR-associated protein Cse1/CasA [Desulfolutivibrio sulfoxidireducens]|uniref:type I-E CRISPR-associated protein Cse1/CasA n=1 Tax=Desulfolutivibrio sulfoxidireducens TaxID=2773299 RepID=UPI00159D65C2|nr:type I-E CRISPR-associated protein Cse1/CasA [Desulfolutivibrio sulfoxidireducens]QLA20887.1 type I-E CRISPR-associated protein Cse1/CasA [Desulfolutivibrio sulfoxidireducens]
MPLNLLTDPWIPVRRASGRRESISPCQITSNPDDPVLAVSHDRPDLAAGLTEFLVSLYQVCLPPRDERAWDSWRDSPPTPHALAQALAPYADVFILDGDGPRFLQDLTVADDPKVKEKPVDALFIDYPGEDADTSGADFFRRITGPMRLCPACAAAALFVLQAWSPAGGQGNRTSLRGGGPLSTIVLGPTLWDTVWRNILPAPLVDTLPGDPAKPREAVFPWLAPARTSGKDGRDTTASDIHPRQTLYGMPRRVRLLFSTGPAIPCSACGAQSATWIERILAKNYGVNYTGVFDHPLTPYRQESGKEPYTVKASPIVTRYRNWIGLTFGATSEKGFVQRPALAVRHFLDARAAYEIDEGIEADRLWAFGFDMDKAKAKAWIEATAPVFVVPEEHRQAYADKVRQATDAAGLVCANLNKAVRKALADKGRTIKSDAAFPAAVEEAFYRSTEAIFYKWLLALAATVGQEPPSVKDRERFLRDLCSVTYKIFERYLKSASLDGELGAGRDLLARKAKAFKELNNFNTPGNDTLRTIMDLPVLEKDVKRPSKTGRKAKGG